MADNEEMGVDELIYSNGLNGSTKAYLTPPMKAEELLAHILQEQEPDNQDILKAKLDDRETHYAPIYGVDAKNIAEAGWGVIYGAGVSAEVKEALSPLIEFRKAQAGALFKEYLYQGESSRDFLANNDTGLGAADPEEMPYYLLLVGSPQDIPYNFQYELDVDRAVGRLYFDTADEYDNYARSVVAAERGEVRLPRQASFFGVANPGDRATELSTELLLEPMYQDFKTKLTAVERAQQWYVRAYLRDEATRASLGNLLGGSAADTPAFLLTGSHGMAFDRGDKYQVPHQGALVCQDWDGNPASISEDVYFAGEHIPSDARLHGMISFFFACYGAGTPAHDEFMRKVEGTAKPIADSAFLAGLPRRMLSHPRGGALAVIGHIERAWTHSFKWTGRTSAQRAHFTSTLGRLFDGYPVGYAFDFINERHASASVQLISLLEKKRRKLQVKDMELIQTWTQNNDARDYIILGDPAVRMCVPEKEDEKPMTSTIELKDIDPASYQPGAAIAGQPEEPEIPGIEAVEAEVGVTAIGDDDAEAMSIIPADLREQVRTALQNVTRQIAGALQDLSTLEVLTYLSDDDLENAYQNGQFSDRARLKAVTLIALDGDIKNMIPARKVETVNTDDNTLTVSVEVDESLLKIHRDMVALAQSNRTNFFKNLADIAVTLVNTRL